MSGDHWDPIASDDAIGQPLREDLGSQDVSFPGCAGKEGWGYPGTTKQLFFHWGTGRSPLCPIGPVGLCRVLQAFVGPCKGSAFIRERDQIFSSIAMDLLKTTCPGPVLFDQ